MTDETRVYGMAEQADPPSAQGLRGEKPSTRPRDRDPQFSHAIRLDSGRTVVVNEGSGVAYAEATGRIGGSADTEAPDADTAEPRRSRLPLILGALAAGGAAGLYLAERRRRDSEGFEPAGQEHISDELPLTGQ